MSAVFRGATIIWEEALLEEGAYFNVDTQRCSGY